MTTLEVVTMSEEEAHKVTEDIRHSAKAFTEYRVRLMVAVDRAKEGNAHLALGYASWTGYLSDVLGQEPMRLARAERQDMVRMLSDEGMSTRAIAPIVGADQKTIVNDRRAAREEFSSPEPAPANVNTETGEIHDTPVDCAKEPSRNISEVKEPSKVTGLDGKQYNRPVPQTPRRKALTEVIDPKLEQVWSLSLELIDTVEDDRFIQNRTVITERSISRLRATAVSITDFLAALDLEAAAGTKEVRERVLADLNHISETCQRLASSL